MLGNHVLFAFSKLFLLAWEARGEGCGREVHCDRNSFLMRYSQEAMMKFAGPLKQLTNAALLKKINGLPPTVAQLKD